MNVKNPSQMLEFLVQERADLQGCIDRSSPDNAIRITAPDIMKRYDMQIDSMRAELERQEGPQPKSVMQEPVVPAPVAPAPSQTLTLKKRP